MIFWLSDYQFGKACRSTLHLAPNPVSVRQRTSPDETLFSDFRARVERLKPQPRKPPMEEEPE